MAETLNYAHVHLTDWPFTIVPTPRGATFMADRTELREELRLMLRRLSRRSPSSIHLMWAWFGAGKTHALHHLAHLCATDAPSIIPIYTELPKSARGFLDLFQQVAVAWQSDEMADSYLEAITHPDGESEILDLQRGYGADAIRAMGILLSGQEREKEIVLRWLQAERMPVAMLREAGLNRPLATAEHAAQVFSTLVKVHGLSRRLVNDGVGRVIWIIDEFQRIARCSKGARDEISAAIHTLINSTPHHLTVILSFSGKPEKNLPEWLSPAISDRVGNDRVMIIPPLRSDEAKVFIKDLLAGYRPIGYDGPSFFPFSEECVEFIIRKITSETDLKPRSLMQYFNAVFEDAELAIEEGKMTEIDAKYAATALKERVFVGSDDED